MTPFTKPADDGTDPLRWRCYSSTFIRQAARRSHRPAPTKPATGGTDPLRWYLTGPALDTPTTANRARAVNSGTTAPHQTRNRRHRPAALTLHQLRP